MVQTISGVKQNLWRRQQGGLYAPSRRNFPIDGLALYLPLGEPSQASLLNGTGIATEAPLALVGPAAQTFNVTQAGTFKIYLQTGQTGTATAGTMAVTGSPVALVGGLNTITTTGATGNFTVAVPTIISKDLNAHVATVTGASWGVKGRAFSGGDDLININAALTPLASTTMGAWEVWGMMPDTTPAATSVLISFGDTNVVELIYLAVLATGKIRVNCYDAGVEQWGFDTDAALFTDSVSFHIAMVHNGTTPSIYVNGVAKAHTFFTTTDKTKWFSALTGLDNGRLGCFNYNSLGNTGWWTGTMGEVRFYSRVLTASEVMNNYLATKWRYQ